MSELGRKFDKEKLRWDLFPFKALESTVRVLMMGSAKYEDNNWKYVKGCRKRYYSAAMRHLTEWHEGNPVDEESGETHLAHALCCIIFLAWHELHQTEEFLEDEEFTKVKDSEVSQARPPLPSFEDDHDIRTGECVSWKEKSGPLDYDWGPISSPWRPSHPDEIWETNPDNDDSRWDGEVKTGPTNVIPEDIEMEWGGQKIILKVDTEKTEEEEEDEATQNDNSLFDNVATRFEKWCENFKQNRD